MEIAIVIVAAIGYLAFRQWLHFQQRTMIHRERLAAVEKGVDLPLLEQEVRRSIWNLQWFLLLAGLIWVSLEVGTLVTLSALPAHPTPVTQGIPQGLPWIGAAPVCIGLSHLIVYLTGRRKERYAAMKTENGLAGNVIYGVRIIVFLSLAGGMLGIFVSVRTVASLAPQHQPVSCPLGWLVCLEHPGWDRSLASHSARIPIAKLLFALQSGIQYRSCVL